jgi:hypothetical protein
LNLKPLSDSTELALYVEAGAQPQPPQNRWSSMQSVARASEIGMCPPCLWLTGTLRNAAWQDFECIIPSYSCPTQHTYTETEYIFSVGLTEDVCPLAAHSTLESARVVACGSRCQETERLSGPETPSDGLPQMPRCPEGLIQYRGSASIPLSEQV